MSKKEIKPNQESAESKRIQVEKMFNSISNNYDFMNKMMTLGMDKKWRKKVLQIVTNHHPDSILDVATGTGDMPLLLASTSAKKIIGVDISEGMLLEAKRKIKEQHLEDRITTSLQDSESMDFDENSFDAITVLYGIRNFEHLEVGLKEIYRVLQSDGIFVILETSVPENKIMQWGYKLYTKYLLPQVAKLFADDYSAYKYLFDSARAFPYGTQLKDILSGVGFQKIQILPQFFGASTIYIAQK